VLSLKIPQNKRRFILLDGGLATELEARGSDLNHELWSALELIDHPERIRDVHLAFLRAGADCIATTTYQASFEGFARQGYSEEDARKLMHRAVDLAREARDLFLNEGREGTSIHDRPLIAGSIGPYGAFLADGSEYRGDYDATDEQLSDFHHDRLFLLADAGVDVLAFETIPSYREAKVLLNLLESRPSIQAWFSFSCRDEEHISDSTPVSECARLLADSDQVVAIGVNCVSPSLIPGLIQTLRRAAPSKPVIVYPNSGEVYDPQEKKWTGIAEPVEFGRAAIEWYNAGARMIGGCCRTTPLHISAMRSSLGTG
jgi:homocysteine S-methyltransferase